MDEATYAEYSDRLSQQMYKIQEVGKEIESNFPYEARACHDQHFIRDAMSTFKSVGGQRGDAALEIYRDIDKDIGTVKNFLDRWKKTSDPSYRTILDQANSLHEELLALKSIIVDAGPVIMEKAKQRIRAQRSGCFVATVCYGVPNAPEVETLRRIRDTVLMKTTWGRICVRIYYSGVGELAADFVKNFLPTTIPVVRKALNLLVNTYQSKKKQ